MTFLRAWRPELEVLGAPARELLGPWLPRLEARLGRTRRARRDPAGEVDGYGGLVRRGSFDRLLLSEWALFEAWPEEFLRRAAVGEQSFLEVARTQPVSGRKIVVLFDRGPHQAGLPRLGHLALLLLAHRRARSTGAELQWGFVQAPSVVHEGLRTESLHAFARRASVVVPSEESVREALERHAPDAQSAEAWCVGGTSLRPYVGSDHRLFTVRVPVGLGAPSSLEIEERDGARVVLPAPPPGAALKALRRPRPRPSAPSEAPTPRGRGTLSARGQHIFRRHPQGLTVSRLAPPPKPCGRLIHLPMAGRVLAAGARGRRYFVLAGDDDYGDLLRLVLFEARGVRSREFELSGREPLIAPGIDEAVPTLWSVGKRRTRFHFVDPLRRHVQIDTETGESRVVAENVLGIFSMSGGPGRLSETGDDGVEIMNVANPGQFVRAPPDLDRAAGALPVVHEPRRHDREAGAFVYRSRETQRWHFYGMWARSHVAFDDRPGWSVLGGVVSGVGRNAARWLVWMDESRTEIEVEGPTSHTLETTSPMTRAVLPTAGGGVMLIEQGDLQLLRTLPQLTPLAKAPS